LALRFVGPAAIQICACPPPQLLPGLSCLVSVRSGLGIFGPPMSELVRACDNTCDLRVVPAPWCASGGAWLCAGSIPPAPCGVESSPKVSIINSIWTSFSLTVFIINSIWTFSLAVFPLFPPLWSAAPSSLIVVFIRSISVFIRVASTLFRFLCGPVRVKPSSSPRGSAGASPPPPPDCFHRRYHSTRDCSLRGV
jgi:hypothetical protein